MLAGVNLAREEAYRQMKALGFRTAIQGVAMHRGNEPAIVGRGSMFSTIGDRLNEGNGMRSLWRAGGAGAAGAARTRRPPPGPGEVQVRIAARGVQYVDVLMLAGKYQFRPEPPFIPGNEAAGEVVAVGDGVTRFKKGDKVMNRVRLGAFGTLANSREGRRRPDPERHERRGGGGKLRGAHHTAYHALMQRGRLQADDWVLIHGAAGGIGIAAIQVAKLYGAKVIATASTEEKRAACLEEGADYAIDYRDGFRDRVKEITGAHDGVDICYDPIGAGVFDESLRCLAFGGRILVLGFLGGGPSTPRTNYLLIKCLEVIGVRLGGVTEHNPRDRPRQHQSCSLELAGQGKIEAAHLASLSVGECRRGGAGGDRPENHRGQGGFGFG